MTPYAKEYGVPWLYGVTALADIGRVAKRRHWLSDTVAGSVLGYGIGPLMWNLNRERAKSDPRIAFKGESVEVSWDFK